MKDFIKQLLIWGYSEDWHTWIMHGLIATLLEVAIPGDGHGVVAYWLVEFKTAFDKAISGQRVRVRDGILDALFPLWIFAAWKLIQLGYWYYAPFPLLLCVASILIMRGKTPEPE
jgi:hypothetical protein